jgi:hypothetical protein
MQALRGRDDPVQIEDNRVEACPVEGNGWRHPSCRPGWGLCRLFKLGIRTPVRAKTVRHGLIGIGNKDTSRENN